MNRKQLAYIETKRPPKNQAALVSLILQHWQSRFLYGKALIITDDPTTFLKAARKKWSSLMQTNQEERTHTFDADRLLQLTHAITRMQQMTLAADPPHEYPAAHCWIALPETLTKTELPRTCRTVYITAELTEAEHASLDDLLPGHSLVVDFAKNEWELPGKKELDNKVYEAWQELQTFLQAHDIHTRQLIDGQASFDAMDDALDTLLETSTGFLRHARHFQEVLHLAQPLSLTHATRQEYDVANTLARRVAMLSPGIIHHSFLQTDNDTFSLYDATTQKISRESLSAAIARHLKAGRQNLAQALETAFVNNSLSF